MKKVVVTITVGEKYEKLAEVTHPSMKAYAERIGADFLVWRDFEGHTLPAYKKMDVHELLDIYDRVIYLDTDLIVRDDCPDLFEIVPEDRFGAFDEFFTNRVQAMMTFQPDLEWVKKKKYFNTGVFVCSKMHKAIFEPAEEVNNFYEQTLLNYKIYTHAFETFTLSHRLNRMTCTDGNGENRFDAYIMHYAGCPLSTEALVLQMQSDLATWKTRPSFYPRQIHFDANGGLGDQVCCEPTIRYLKETAYKNDNIRVSTNYPELFRHLDVDVINKNTTPVFTQGCFSVNLPPNSDTYLVNNHILTHPIEAVSLAAFRGQLPPMSKTVRLVGAELPETTASIAKKCVLVHAGRSWQTKTFPKLFWRELIDSLIAIGIPVMLIGKHVDAQFGYVDLGEFTSPLVHDFRDRLSLSELISVIEIASLGLVSNDSSPVHIAGAFENPIHLITIAKADFRLMPFRHGRQDYKAYSYGTLLPFRFESNCTTEVRMDIAPSSDIVASLPSPNEIVYNILGGASCVRRIG